MYGAINPLLKPLGVNIVSEANMAALSMILAITNPDLVGVGGILAGC
jgi:hypothetical protein